MPPVTFRSPAVTDVTAGGAAGSTAAAVAAVRVCVAVRVVSGVPAHRLSSPARTGRGPPAESLYSRTTPEDEADRLRPFCFSASFKKGNP
jgi:hypothetical protein